MQIEEVKNDKYIIKPVKMSNDGMIDNIDKDAAIPSSYSFFLIIVGSVGSGKTTFWINLLKKNKKKNNYYQKFDKVFIFSNSFKTITEQLKLPDDRIKNGISELDETIEGLDDTDKVLIVLDDCVCDLKQDKNLTKYLYNRRHMSGGISWIIITQTYNKIPLEIRKAASHICIFSTGNKKQLASIYQDQINIEESDYKKIINFCFHDIHDFFIYNCTTSTFYNGFNKLLLTFT